MNILNIGKGILALFVAASCSHKVAQIPQPVKTLVTVNASATTKTTLGAPVEGVRKTYWNSGDLISINGIGSEPLGDIDPNVTSVTFEFDAALEFPYRVLYPSSAWKTASSITLPSTQTYVENSFDPAAAIAIGYASQAGEISLTAPCAVLKLSLSSAENLPLSEIEVQGGDGEQLCGEFAVDYEHGTIEGASSADADKIIRVDASTLTIGPSSKDVYIVIPAVTYAEGFRICVRNSSGEAMTKAKASSTVISAGKVYNMPTVNFVPDPTPITTADQLMDFASRVNSGQSYDKYVVDGVVSLDADIDLSGKTWVPIGNGTCTSTGEISGASFSGVFNGNNHRVDNLSLAISGSAVGTVGGLFGILNGATVRNVIMGEHCSITGTCSDVSFIGGIAGFALDSSIDRCKNYGSLAITAQTDSKRECLGGIAGQVYTINDVSSVTYCKNYGTLTSTNSVNTNNGANGISLGGIVGFSDANASHNYVTVQNCTNEAPISAQATRLAGIDASANSYTKIISCTNNATVSGTDVTAKNSRVAGICSAASSGVSIENCVNKGDINFPIASNTTQGYAAGIIGQTNNTVIISGCTNYGAIRSDKIKHDTDKFVGIILANANGKNVTIRNCFISGSIGPWTEDSNNKVVAITQSNYSSYITPAAKLGTSSTLSNNTFQDLDWTMDSYYEWTRKKTYSPCSGVTYSRYQFTRIPLQMNVLEIDLTNPAVELTTGYADDCVPNPNGNGNSNNGFNKRETLSQMCTRKRNAGIDIVAGVNSGFFDSNDGIARGFHIENGEPVYINNTTVFNNLKNHRWALTVYTDGTASCGARSFSGKIKAGTTEFSYSSVNDTTLRHTSSTHKINLYDRHYVRVPHSGYPSIVNELAKNALYVIAEYIDEPMKVNCGYAAARVVSISDGRTSPLSSAPYITQSGRVGIALSGTPATNFLSLISVGSEISLRCDVAVEGEVTRPILTQNAAMFSIMKNGEDNTSSIPSGQTVVTQRDPLTFPVVSEDRKTVWLVEIDGRRDDSRGVLAYEMYRIAKKLGGWNMTRFDGGGSSAMWVYNPSTSTGGLVNTPSDTKGERSCMNYILVRAKH